MNKKVILIGIVLLIICVIMVVTIRRTPKPIDIADNGINVSVGIEQEIEEYKINSIVKTDEGIKIDYLYDNDKVKDIMSNTNREEFMETLENWSYSNDPQLSTPTDTIQGKSNCRGITLYIAEWLIHNVGDHIDGHNISIGTSKDDVIDHMYLKVKPTGHSVQIWDMSVDKGGSILMINNFLDNYPQVN